MAGSFTTNEYMLKFYMIDHAIRYHRTDAAFVRLSANVTAGHIEEVEAHLNEFARLCIPELVAFLPH